MLGTVSACSKRIALKMSTETRGGLRIVGIVDMPPIGINVTDQLNAKSQ